MLGFIKLKDDHGQEASQLMTSTARPVKKEAALIRRPDSQGEKEAVMIKDIAGIRVNMPSSGTAVTVLPTHLYVCRRSGYEFRQ